MAEIESGSSPNRNILPRLGEHQRDNSTSTNAIQGGDGILCDNGENNIPTDNKDSRNTKNNVEDNLISEIDSTKVDDNLRSITSRSIPQDFVQNHEGSNIENNFPNTINNRTDGSINGTTTFVSANKTENIIGSPENDFYKPEEKFENPVEKLRFESKVIIEENIPQTNNTTAKKLSVSYILPPDDKSHISSNLIVTPEDSIITIVAEDSKNNDNKIKIWNSLTIQDDKLLKNRTPFSQEIASTKSKNKPKIKSLSIRRLKIGIGSKDKFATDFKNVSTTYKKVCVFTFFLPSKTSSEEIMGAIQLGIAYSVGKLTAVPERDVLFTDFYKIQVVQFPRTGSTVTPSHRFPDFSMSDYGPEGFRYFRDIFSISPSDFMGSTYGRKASTKERSKPSPTFKDLDFMERHPNGLVLLKEHHERLIKTLERDTRVLESFGIMDYSLLVAIHNVTLSKRRSTLNVEEKMEMESPSSWRPRNLGIGVTSNNPNDSWSDGIPARNRSGDELILFIGIIDILQSYRAKKILEHHVKALVQDKDKISVHNPKFYAARFLKFCKYVFQTEMQNICYIPPSAKNVNTLRKININSMLYGQEDVNNDLEPQILNPVSINIEVSIPLDSTADSEKHKSSSNELETHTK